MKQILLVEDSQLFGRLTKARMEAEFDRPVYWTKNLEETVKLLDRAGNDFSIALLDLHLPDAPNGEVIDLVVNRGISSFVFTSNMSDAVREQMWSKRVADYILKDDPNSLSYIIQAIRRLEKNQDTLILVVDDSSLFRSTIAELLYVQKFRVVTAKNGPEALAILQSHPEVTLVLTDYNMPGMDGCILCQKIRGEFSREDLAIIGISSEEEVSIGARFIKSGADDFIMKHSFLVEEFYCRVNRCIEGVELFAERKEAATKDFLTGLYNRRYFFETGEMRFGDCRQGGRNLVCAMMDIDLFKRVNDTYGHDTGDRVIRLVADCIHRKMGPTAVVARFGGEEFCVLIDGLEPSEADAFFEELRRDIEAMAIALPDAGGEIHVSVSIGVCRQTRESLTQMISVADRCLYEAKNSGRNCLRGSA